MKALFAAVLLTSNFAMANTLEVKNGTTYVGQELLNENPTGNICYVKIEQVIDTPERGNLCKNMTVQFLHNTDKITREPVLLYSRVTNNHRAEYPKVKTCVENINGTSYGNEIYGKNTEILYNPLFSAMGKNGMTSYDYYLSVGADTKDIFRSRVHVMSWFSENNLDCVNLRLL